MTVDPHEFDDEFLAVSKPASPAKSLPLPSPNQPPTMTPQPRPVRRVSKQTKIRRSIVAKLESLTPDEVGTDKDKAIGRPPKRGKSGLTINEEQRLTSRAVNNGWIKERFPVSETIESIKKIPKKELTSAQLVIKTAINGCEKGKTIRDQIRAAKILVDAVKVNQTDEINEVPPAPIGVGVAVNVNNTGDSSATASVEASGPRVVLYLPENGR